MLLIISSSDSTNQNSSSFSYFEDNLDSEVKKRLPLPYISSLSSFLFGYLENHRLQVFYLTPFYWLSICVLFIFCPLTCLVNKLRLLKYWVSDFTLFLNKCFDSFSTSFAVPILVIFCILRNQNFIFLNILVWF